jgi:GAF domain-containing protein/anti-sigma regulatory factor (Ser/Thr protein kinase)
LGTTKTGADVIETRLAEALAYSAALAEVLTAITRTPPDLDAVFKTIVDNSVRLCHADNASFLRAEGNLYREVAYAGRFADPEAHRRFVNEQRFEPAQISRLAHERRTVQIEDFRNEPNYEPKRAAEAGIGARTMLSVPVLAADSLPGIIVVRRSEVRLFDAGEIAILETFAQQAAIAIENVRLFNETKESLGQQTALSDVLKTISRSAFDLDSVLQTIVERAAALGGADTATITRRDGDDAIVLAQFGPTLPASFGRGTRIPVNEGTMIGRALLTGQRQYVVDASEHPELPQDGPRTRLGIPFLRDGKATGVLGVSHLLPQPFSDRELQMLETFADQAAIAIENVRLFNETKEALERQTAVGEILRVMSSSPTDVQPVLEAIAKSASEFCAAPDVLVNLLDANDRNRIRAHHGDLVMVQQEEREPFNDRSVSGRAMVERRTIHIPDLQADATRFPAGAAASPTTRAIAAAPLLRMGRPIGAIILRRSEAIPFTDRQIELAETFADQAAIAIENVRLFNETKESLERQTAIGDVLRVMSSSPTAVQPVLDVIVSSARRFCGAEDAGLSLLEGDGLVNRAHEGNVGFVVGSRIPLDRGSVAGRSFIDAATVQVLDLQAEETEYPVGVSLAREFGIHTALTTPLLREGKPIGTLGLRRLEIRPFTQKQIELLRTFADQAVIAIENVRLFNETKEALERQTAIGEILRAIAKSPIDEVPVLRAIAESATRFCGAGDATVVILRGDELVPVAHHGPIPTNSSTPLKFDRTSLSARAMMERRTLHVSDVLGPEGDEYPQARQRHEATKQRALLAAPLFREGTAIGAILLRKLEPIGFTPNQIALVEAFADQAVIAIENVRLFNETQEALKQLTATSEILRVISETLGDPQPVMQAIVDTVLGVCLADSAGFFRRSGDDVVLRAVSGSWRGPRPSEDGQGVPFHGDSIVVQALEEGRYQHVPDTSADPRYDAAARWSRTRLAVPVLRGSETIGVIRVGRTEPGGFSQNDIRLVEGFAEQAAIAFENARLFNETKEALEQQTAVGDVLKTISRSAFDLQPVLDIVLNNAVRLAGADIGWLSRVEDEQWATVAYSSEFPQVVRDELAKQRVQGHLDAWIPIGNRAGVMGLTLSERRTVHVSDVKEDEELKGSVVARLSESRTVVGVPMLREGRSIGAVVLARYEVRPFDEREIELVQTFADQAAIAIENVRLFNDTKESLERQSAVSEVLKTISRTVFDLGPTLQTVVENAARLCEADAAWMSQRVADARLAINPDYTQFFGARWARTPELLERFNTTTVRASDHPRSIMGRTYLERATIALDDITAEKDLDHSGTAFAVGARSVLSVPVLRDDETLGVMVFARTTIRPFAAREIELVETFADQAAIAIQNVRLFNEIQDKSQQLEIASRHKSEFLANMSHELRTPLNAIIGFSEVLLQGIFGDVNEKQREYLADVLGSGQHLLSLINDILDLSKIEAGRMDLDLTTFAIREALESGLTIVRERAARNGIKLSTVVASDVGTIEADERKVKQILYNLLSNAVKFTPDGGRVDVSVRADNGDVRVEVRDTGIGVAAEDQERIFEEFRQVGRERSREGTGLGLTLTKRFIELHGGRIWLESSPGKGSTFAFTLPVRRAAAVGA